MAYKETLNLPKTEFQMKANLAVREPLMLKRWQDMHLYDEVIGKGKSKPKFIFHDGPPYANGHLHLGTMLNKILKDIVVKYRNMAGWQCSFIPGWDCHGLPIELEVDKKLGPKRKEMSPVDIRKECRKHAQSFVEIQREEFKRLGCLGRWESPYLTMSFEYEAAIAREFGKFVKGHYVYKAKKPIFWCPSCVTALAEAEVEYADHSSPSIYVKFRLLDDEELRKKIGSGNEPISLVIWTTTPWTIPANLGISLHPDLPYVAVDVGGEIWILASGLMDSVMAAVGKTYYKVVAKLSAKELEHKSCRHPLIDRKSLIMLGEHVTLDAGTGAVHTAPGHGQEDYEVGLKYGLDILAPVDDRGRFTAEVGLGWLVGKGVEESNQPIVEALEKAGALIKSEKVSHSYPHCWRCKKPIIFRSTEQWFISLEQNKLRESALDEIQKVKWIPHWGENRIRGMLAVRPDWCVSRQRLWGVPIPAIVCKNCGASELLPEVIENAVGFFEKEGADAWFARPTADFIPKGTKCPKCGGTEFGAEKDILDVWFDSGVSYAAVLERMEGLADPADLYLEGSDQHRGWFHTALLTSVGTRGRAPYKSVLTHGFVVDGEGKKLSKSAKNYVPPEEIISKQGAEIIRLWVSSEDYRDDIRMSEEIIARAAESYRKLRNTCRFVLGNLFDFDPKDALPIKEMREIDRFAIYLCSRLVERIKKAFEEYEFHAVYHSLNKFAAVDMSAFYFDILKDCLYTDASKGKARLSAQTAMWQIIEAMVRLMAPIYSFTADEIWEFIPKIESRPKSVFLADMPEAMLPEDKKFEDRWDEFRKFRNQSNKALEEARARKFIGNSLEARLVIDCKQDLKEFLQTFEPLADLLIVSDVAFEGISGEAVVSDEIEGLKFKVEKAPGSKCPRCWKYAKVPEGQPCGRCSKVLSELGK